MSDREERNKHEIKGTESMIRIQEVGKGGGGGRERYDQIRVADCASSVSIVTPDSLSLSHAGPSS